MMKSTTMMTRWSSLSQAEKGYPVAMSDEEKDARAAQREAEKAADAVREQGQEDARAKLENPDEAYSRGADEQIGGESFGYGSPAPGAGPTQNANPVP